MDGYYGYGGNVTQQATEEKDAKVEQYVANVSAAHSANQNSIQQLVARKNMQAVQIIRLQQQTMVYMNQPPAMSRKQYQP